MLTLQQFWSNDELMYKIRILECLCDQTESLNQCKPCSFAFWSFQKCTELPDSRIVSTRNDRIGKDREASLQFCQSMMYEIMGMEQHFKLKCSHIPTCNFFKDKEKKA